MLDFGAAIIGLLPCDRTSNYIYANVLWWRPFCSVFSSSFFFYYYIRWMGRRLWFAVENFWPYLTCRWRSLCWSANINFMCDSNGLGVRQYKSLVMFSYAFLYKYIYVSRRVDDVYERNMKILAGHHFTYPHPQSSGSFDHRLLSAARAPLPPSERRKP